ncbi:MAG TPA: TOBE domain-containing protein [Planctomycetota bacterium]|nr:TOBE domain-containing protein [Planctomycetota bacterium]
MNAFDAVVESAAPAESLAWLRLPRGRLAARLACRKGERLRIGIRPEEVLLCAGHPGLVSARNVIPGRVRTIREVPEGVYVTVDAEPPLVAMVTRGAVRDLRLARGRPVFLVVKASSVVVRETARAPVLVSVVGSRGVLTPALLSLLKAIRETGSLTAAAEAEGVTYRTAWLRAERANRAWGAALVARRRGGRGGGGAILTPQGEAVLRLARKQEPGRSQMRPPVRSEGPATTRARRS